MLFRSWDKPLSPKSAADYVGYFSTALNAAVRAEVIPENPIMTLAATERIKVPESKREYLTIDEIKVLIDTECPREDVKRAYLFACYCGLRLSDVYALRWKDIVQDGLFDYERAMAANAASQNGSQVIFTNAVNDHDWYGMLRDRKSTRLNSSHTRPSRMPSSA